MVETNALTEKIIGCCIEVHRHLGPGLLESAYEETLCRELSLQNIPYQRQMDMPIDYKGSHLDAGYRIDLLVGNEVIVEIKSVEKMNPVFSKQLLTYLRLSGKRWGLLINFNVGVLKDGIERIVNGY
jgi:GxxExxY protein